MTHRYSEHADRAAPRNWLRWWPVVIGLVGMYTPTYVALARGAWTTDEQAHGPMVLAIALWLVWRQRSRFLTLSERPNPVAGALLLVVGLFAYILGRSQDIPILDVGSQLPVLGGILLCVYGWRGVRLAWFPILFLAYLIPLPGMLVDALTGPLKEYVSVLTERMLYAAGYPIARDGMTLAIGAYQLLVADACSGLHSMYSLSAVGLLYVYLVKPKGLWRKALLILSMIPIAFMANLVRVIALVLITYYFGDAAGQGFLHGMAGVLLFAMAIGMVIALDWLLVRTHRASVAGNA